MECPDEIIKLIDINLHPDKSFVEDFEFACTSWYIKNKGIYKVQISFELLSPKTNGQILKFNDRLSLYFLNDKLYWMEDNILPKEPINEILNLGLTEEEISYLYSGFKLPCLKLL